MPTVTGAVHTLIQADNGDVLAATHDQGTLRIYKSSDNGQTWTVVYSATAIIPTVLAVPHKFTKDNLGNIYLAVTSEPSVRGVYKSVDHGVTWTRVNALPQLSHLTTGEYGATDIAFAANSNTLAVSVAGKLTSGENFTARSTDLGVSWSAGSIPSGWGIRAGTYQIVAAPLSVGEDFIFVSYNPNPPLCYLLTNQGGLENPANTPFVGGSNTPSYPVKLVSFTYEDENGRLNDPVLFAMQNSAANIWVRNTKLSSGNNITPISDIPVSVINTLYADPVSSPTQNRTIWAGCGTGGQIYVSYNNGFTWALFEATSASSVLSFVRTTSGVLISGGDGGEIFLYGGSGGSGGGGTGEEEEEEEPGGTGGGGGTDPGPGVSVVNTFSLGREITQDGLVPVINRFSYFNITHVFNHNGTSYFPLQFSSNPPYTLFNAAPAVGQAIYFGSQTTDPASPGGTFSSLVFNLVQISFNFTVVWEYYNGAWISLPVQDNTEGFRKLGENSVHWSTPVDWTQTSVNGINGYFVRARITAIDDIGQVPLPPIHDERFVYTVNLPYVSIGKDQVSGDIPALGQVLWKNLSDGDNGGPQLAADRVLVGLRSVSRGLNFNSFLNITDQQTAFGVVVTPKFGNSEFISYLLSPSNRAYQFSHDASGTLNAWNNMVDVTFDTTVAKDYYGTYRAFLRCAVDSPGDEDSWKYRLKITFGSGGAVKYSKEFPVLAIDSDFVCLDMGSVSIPSTTIFTVNQNIGDILTITVQGYCVDEDVTSRLYDLILIPVDEWMGDARIADLLDDTIPNKISGSNYIDFDSISNLKTYLTTYNRKSSGFIKSIYQSITNGPLILQKSVRQRFWFLLMSYDYDSNMWLSRPEISGDVKINKVQRYKALRGKR